MDQILLVTRVSNGKNEPVGLCKPTDRLSFCSDDFRNHHGVSPGYISIGNNTADLCELHIEYRQGKLLSDVEEFVHDHYTFQAMDVYEVKKEEDHNG